MIHQSFVGKSFWKFPKCWASSRSSLDGRPSCPWTIVLQGMTIPIFLTQTTLMDELEFIQSSVHHQLSPCPRVVQSTVEFIAFLWTCVFMLVVRHRATCHDLIGGQSRRFNFSRNIPCVILQLVVSFQMPNFIVYKQQNSSPSLHIDDPPLSFVHPIQPTLIGSELCNEICQNLPILVLLSRFLVDI